MKRFITILAVLSLTTCVLAGNNDVPKMIKVDIGAYQGNNQKLRAQAYMNPDSTQLIAIGLEAGYTYPNARKLARYPYIYIEYTDSLISTLSTFSNNSNNLLTLPSKSVILLCNI